MARKQRSSLLEDLIELVSLLPWWGGVVLAVISYLVLHWFAAPAAPSPVSLQQMPSAMSGMVFRVVASVGQYALPIICLFAAALSAWRRHTRRSLVANVAQSDTPLSLNAMSWQEFEALVSEAFCLDGFRVAERGGAGADGGIDLVLYRDQEKFLVQCKQWKARQVSVNVVRELFGVMAAENATGGFVVTSGQFTADAITFAEGRNIILVDGPILHDMVARAKPAPASNARRNPLLANDSCAEVACPQCASPMVRRIAKYGANAGGAFWGCSRYPSCKGVRQI